jgi:hypothetical protein
VEETCSYACANGPCVRGSLFVYQFLSFITTSTSSGGNLERYAEGTRSLTVGIRKTLAITAQTPRPCFSPELSLRAYVHETRIQPVFARRRGSARPQHVEEANSGSQSLYYRRKN